MIVYCTVYSIASLKKKKDVLHDLFVRISNYCWDHFAYANVFDEILCYKSLMFVFVCRVNQKDKKRKDEKHI